MLIIFGNKGDQEESRLYYIIQYIKFFLLEFFLGEGG
jgi:hypothetical protein